MNALHESRETMAVSAIASVREQMLKEGDRKHAGKMGELESKASDALLRIAFCGHFSAGKSSLINKLCGHQLLPSSPIPTSANVVTIASGEAGAIIMPITGGEPVGIPLDQLDAYCKNGTDIASVEIRYPIPLLGGRAALLDTPGIDSTDSAHMMATESALHMADVVFYVMDYNHVQSEVNFAFCKRLKEWGKPLYLIVNQIDKHRDRELSFEEYRLSVKHAFENWHIQPDGILYTSVKLQQHPLNEWPKLERLIGELIGLSEPLRSLSMTQSARHLSGEHVAWVRERSEDEKQSLREAMDEDELPVMLEQVLELEAERKKQLTLAEEYTTQLKKEIVHLLENAPITPAVMRDLAHEYLQSRKPGFKVGFFARAAANAKEVETRLEAFAANFKEQVQTHIVWHLRQLLVRESERYAGVVAVAELDATLEQAAGSLGAAWLAAQVQAGASFSGEYTLNYSRQLAADARSLFRREAFALAEALGARAAAEGAAAAQALAAQLAALEARLGAYRRLQALEASEAAYAAELAA
uniref:dynamin family protein n=1 Tax=Paenibacillus koleovorans TaxID=121608 RepID=UPI001580B440